MTEERLIPPTAPAMSGHPRAVALIPHLADLSAGIVAYWLGRGVDRESGGFHGRLDRKGSPTEPSDKSVVQQARHLWTWSTWGRRRGTAGQVEEVCRSTYDLMQSTFLDPTDGLFRYQTTRDGTIVDPTKLLYAQSFAIYGLAAYGVTFRQDAALDRALRCFRALDAAAHDGRHGGYDQRNEPHWLTGGARKDTNTHLHLMESFAELLLATGDALVRQRLGELVHLICARMLQPEGYVHPSFDADFTPLGARTVSYGHDIETAWLLGEAARALGPDAPDVRQAAVTLGGNAAAWGFDSEQGGLFQQGVPGGEITDREKVWWVQFEALPGLFRLYEWTGDAAHLARLERTLDFIDGPARDAEYGEWYFGVWPDGSVGPRGDHKGEVWKTAYHNLRATLFTEDFIRAWEASGTRQNTLERPTPPNLLESR